MKAAGNKAGFAFYQSEGASKPVYELQKGSKRITYFYTTSATVRDKMTAQGWTYTRIAWYAQPKA